MKKILLALLTLTSVSAFADNYDYQLRTVYYSSTNNLCHGQSDITDKITIDVFVNDKPLKQYITHGAVSCNYSNLVYGRSFSIFNSDSDTDISFSDSKITNGDKTVDMKTTIKNNLVSIDGTKYSCSIKGDGTPDKYNNVFMVLDCKETN